MEKRIEIRQRAPIVSADGENLGEVSRFVLEPDQKRITHVVTERKGFLRSEERVVPFELIAEATPTVISLGAGTEGNDVASFDPDRLGAVTDTDAESAAVLLETGESVSSADGERIGTVKNIVTDGAGHIADITVEPEVGAAPEAVGAEIVERVDQDGVKLSLTRDAFHSRLHVPD